MATHGRAGLDAFLAGSTGQRLSAKAGVPTLLVKAP
jgi:nucleotide-binding universal stress UspA family protein